MNALLAAFGIDWRLLIVNIVNFGILLGVLWYFLYKPLTNMLESRRMRIAEGVQNAEEAARRLDEIEQTRADMLASAGLEADEVLASARKAGVEKQHELISQGEQSSAALLKEAQAQAGELKLQALEESKKEVAKLIVLGMEKVALDKRS
jgi:F-type H+-transporting ATPase subunit b